MDPGEKFDLSKENVQPLKKGRMVCQFGTALLAQADLQIHQELLKQREKYEVLLRTYDGSDPLKPWYEYILWVEQSFLGDGREGNLNVLLERCLTRFKDDEQYLQDTRYIQLWIKYIEMSVNPLELYKKCHLHNIGKYCALFYISWAYDFEKAGDIKRANMIFLEGYKNNAQPRNELEEAHQNFHSRIAKEVLDDRFGIESALSDQRIALNKLQRHGPKNNLVSSVRVGDNIQQGHPGILQPRTQNVHQPNNIHVGTSNAFGGNNINIFNEESDDIESSEFAVLPGTHLSTIPRREVIGQENILKPGPWTGKSHKRQTSVVPVFSHPRQPAFQLHEDEEMQIRSNTPVTVNNALKPRKLDDGDEFKCPMAVFEPEDPTKRPMYCKRKVYAGGMEFSFEELRAIDYMRGNRPRKYTGVLAHEEMLIQSNTPRTINNPLDPRNQDDSDEFKCPVAIFEPEDPTKRPMYCKKKVYAGGIEFSFEELRAVDYMSGIRPKKYTGGHQIADLERQNFPIDILKPNESEEDFECPVVIFEPDDPTKCPMYCKNKVYVGNTEFSFEELRAAEYQKRFESQLHKQNAAYFLEHDDKNDDPTVSKLFGEELHQIKIFESRKYETNHNIDQSHCEPKDSSCQRYHNSEQLRQFEDKADTNQSNERDNFLLDVKNLKYFEEERAMSFSSGPPFSLYKDDTENDDLPHVMKAASAMGTRPQSSVEKHNIQEKNDIFFTCSQSFPEKHKIKKREGSVLSAGLPSSTGHQIQIREDDVLFTCSQSSIEKQKTQEQEDSLPAPSRSSLQKQKKDELFGSSESSVQQKFQGKKDGLLSAQSQISTENQKLLEREAGLLSTWHQPLTEKQKIKRPPDEMSTEPQKVECMNSLATDPSNANVMGSGESCDYSSLHGQSLTYNTKEALNIMQELWTTPDNKKVPYHKQCFSNIGYKKNVLPLFDCEDDVDNVSSSSPFEVKINPFEIYEDENQIDQCKEDLYNGLNILQTDEKDVFEIFRDDQTIEQRLEEPAVHSVSPRHEESTEQFNILKKHTEEINIPTVPSPGMTDEEEIALKGTDTKENIPPENVIPSPAKVRDMMGILQPSVDILCDSVGDPLLAKKCELETDVNNLTCNTQAFSFPLLSSTPFINHVKQASSKNIAQSEDKGSCSGADAADSSQARCNIVGSSNHPIDSLSTIIETTEYCKSSSSSGSSGTTTRLTSVVSRENFTMGSTMKSEKMQNNKYSLETWQENCNTHRVTTEFHNHSEQKETKNIAKDSSSLHMDSTYHQKPKQSCSLTEIALLQESVSSEIISKGRAMPLNSVVLSNKRNDDLKEQELNLSKQKMERHCDYQINAVMPESELLSNENLLKNENKQLENYHNSTYDTEYKTKEEHINCYAYCSKSTEVEEYNLEKEFSSIYVEGNKDIDPFDHSLIQQFLTGTEFSTPEYGDCYKKLDSEVPRFKVGATVILGLDNFAVDVLLGEGSYAKVYKATDLQTRKTVALKVQKPSWEWEFYICRQIQSRLLDPSSASAFMNIHKAYIFNNGSVMTTEYSQYGTLLSAINKLKQNCMLSEILKLYWMVELLSIVQKLQECQIIHGDIKPDNFVLRTLPPLESNELSLQLIDMGRAIDMTLFPVGTTFNKVVTTKDFQCIEMQTKKPWTYQIDLYGVAATMHCIMFGEYMKIVRQNDRWFIRNKIPRYSKRQLWEQFFSTLLNIESCENLPDLSQLQTLGKAEIRSMNSAISFVKIGNILSEKPKKTAR